MKDLIVKISVILPNGEGSYTATVKNIYSVFTPAHTNPAKIAGNMIAAIGTKAEITVDGAKKIPMTAPVRPPVESPKQKAERLGIKVDGRWKDERIDEEIEKAGHGIATFGAMQ